MRRLLLVVIVLAVVAVAADRGAAWAASRVVADQVQSAEHLTRRPQVLMTGTPFLPQLLGGNYRAVEVRAHELRTDQLTVAEVDATLTGVRLPPQKVVQGSITAVRADEVRARVLVRYGDLDAVLSGRNLTVAAAGESLRITGSARVLGRDVSAAAVSDVAVRDGALVVTARKIETGSSLADAALSAVAVGGRFDFTVRPGVLPFGLRLDSVRVRPDGLDVTAVAHAVELGAR